MRHPEFPIAAFLSLPLLLCSLPSHIRAGSVCIIALIAWLAVMSIIRGANALIWADNVIVRLEVWCDITTKITIGFTYAVPASALCVLRHLESVASTRNARITKADKRQRQIFEVVMCFGIPVIFMALHYVVQGHRFDLIENFGCYPTQYFSVAALMILWVPPLVMSLISFVYAGLALRHFLRHRISFAAHLRNSQSSISPGRYFRLMALAIVEMAWDTGVNAYIIWFNVTFGGFQPWISWENVHSNFSRVAAFPEWIFPPIFISQLIWQWWIVPISCIFFFLFFAFGEEAMADYRAVIVWCRRVILRQNMKKPSIYGTILPTHCASGHANINVMLPTVSDDASEGEPKPWDDLSLKMPKVADDVALPPSTDFLPHNVGYVSDFQSTSKPERHTPSWPNAMPLSGDDSQRQASIDSSNSSFIIAGQSVPPQTTQAHPSTKVPLVTVTSPPSPSRASSPTSSRPTSSRRSTSREFEITVSQAYPPDVATTSPYHEALLTPLPFSGAVPSYPDPTYSGLHGGIRMTVEKNVI